MKKQKQIFTCDICGDKAETENGRLPSNWVEISMESRYVDRDFTEKHICDKCCLEITRKHNAA